MAQQWPARRLTGAELNVAIEFVAAGVAALESAIAETAGLHYVMIRHGDGSHTGRRAHLDYGLCRRARSQTRARNQAVPRSRLAVFFAFQNRYSRIRGAQRPSTRAADH